MHNNNPTKSKKAPAATSNIRFEDLPLELPQERNLVLFKTFLTEFQGLGDYIVQQWRNRPVTCVISDALVEWGGYVAEKLGIPWVTLWTSSISDLAVYHNIPRLLKENTIKDLESLITISGLPKLKISDYPSLLQLVNPYFPLRFMMESFVRAVQHTPKADRVLVNSTYALEEAPVTSLVNSGTKVVPIGPLHLLAKDVNTDDDPNEVIPWLDKHASQSILYIAFGTVAPIPTGQIEQIAAALESTDVPFLWAVRDEHLPLVPCGFINTASYRLRGKAKESDTTVAYRGLLTDWVPQSRVLCHRAVGGFLSHCGWNSVLESITAGVPVIARPIVGDQVLTSKLLKDVWGIAIRLSTENCGLDGVVGKDELKDAIEELMVEESGLQLRNQASELAKVVKNAMDSYENVKLLAKDLEMWKTAA